MTSPTDRDTGQVSRTTFRVTRVNRSFDGDWTATGRIMQQHGPLEIESPIRFAAVIPRPQLSVRPTPSGAMVHIDGREVGPAPVDIPIGRGRHKLRLQRRGYRPLTRSFTVAPGEKHTITDTLTTSQGSLVVTSQPKGASISVNDRSIGTTPDSTTLQTGTYDVQLDRDGYQSTRRTVTVHAGSKTHLNIGLERPLRVELAKTHPDVIEDPTLTREEDHLLLTYHLVGKAETYSVTLKLARGEKHAFEPIPNAVSGAVGTNVRPGRNKEIVWRAFEDVPKGLEGSGNRLRIDVDSDDRNRLYWVLGGTLAVGAAVLLGH